MKDKIYTIIYNWVAENFGTSEAEEPSWDIHALSEELAKHFFELYQKQELDWLKEDVENFIADNDEYELTDKQMYAVADKIRNSEWYCSINPEDMEYYINEEMKKGE